MICGADGVALGANALVLVRLENADWAGCADGLGVEVLGKLRPAKASVRPPNESFCAFTGAAIPPNDGWRSCVD